MVATAPSQTITGDEFKNWLFAALGNDTLDGLGGDDQLYDGLGNDTLLGGTGDDELFASLGGYDKLIGGYGHDRFYITAADAGDTVEAVGGAGNDYFMIGTEDWDNRDFNQYSVIYATGDDGNDVFDVYGGGHVRGGAGTDTYLIHHLLGKGTPLKALYIKDFETGPGGDVINLEDALAHVAPNTNPFTTGAVELVQQGNDVIIQFVYERNGIEVMRWSPVILENTQASDLTAENFSGFSETGAPPTVRIGNGGPDIFNTSNGRVTLVGGAGDDVMYDGFYNDIMIGQDGDDTFHVSQGGYDQSYGGSGNDEFFILTTHNNDRAEGAGGDGDDYFRIEALNLSNAFVSGDDGNDTFDIFSGGRVNTGSGQDLIKINTLLGSTNKPTPYLGKTVVIEDFEAGDGGDILSFKTAIQNFYSVDPQTTNLFATNQISLTQKGDHVVVLFSAGGFANNSSYSEAVYLLNTQISDLTAANFGGMDPAGGSHITPIIDGDSANNRLEASFGATTLNGLAGDDHLIDGYGDDVLNGGMGDDTLEVLFGGTTNHLYGEDGDDTLILNRNYKSPYRAYTPISDFTVLSGGNGNDQFIINTVGSETTEAYGGAGDDLFEVTGNYYESLTLFGDDGNDIFKLSAQAVVTGGSGQDTYIVNVSGQVITDFETGADGDVVVLANHVDLLRNFASYTNPFTYGYFRLIQTGSDTVLQFDIDGFTGTRTWQDVIVFRNTNVEDFTADNFGGLELDGKIGTETINGDDGANILRAGLKHTVLNGFGGDDELYDGTFNDILNGGVGDDILTANRSGYDQLFGGAGNNEFYIGSTGTKVQLIEATGGDDAEYFQIDVSNNAKVFAIGNGGDDTFDLWSGANINGGAGRDTFIINDDALYSSKQLVIRGFETGADGDVIDLSKTFRYQGNETTDPFATGQLVLTQEGANAILYIDQDGYGGTYDLVPWVWMLNTDASDLTAANFGGLTPFPSANETPLEEPEDFAEEPAMMEHVHINALHEDLFV